MAEKRKRSTEDEIKRKKSTAKKKRPQPEEERPVNTRPKTASKKKKRRKKKKRFISILAALLGIAVFVAIGVFWLGLFTMNSSKNLGNIKIGDIEVGGLTKAETLSLLDKYSYDEFCGGSLHVTIPGDIEFDVDYMDSGLVMDADTAADLASEYGKNEGILAALTAKLKSFGRESIDITRAHPRTADTQYILSLINPAAKIFDEYMASQPYVLNTETKTLDYLKISQNLKLNENALLEQIIDAIRHSKKELDFIPDTSALTAPDFDALYEELHVEPRDAAYDEEYNVTPEVVGVDFDVAKAKELWDSTEFGGKCSIPVEIDVPEVTMEDLKDGIFKDILGEQTSYFFDSTEGRKKNVALAASKINGLILKPGDEFSYNTLVGQRTVEAGFNPAPAYDGGQVVEEVGGGICQVSSTLYAATIKARLWNVTERHEHQFRVLYLDPGLDATVSWPTPDFRFVNDMELPVMIEAVTDMDACSLTIRIRGTNPDGRFVVIHASGGPKYDWQNPPYLQDGYYGCFYVEVFEEGANPETDTPVYSTVDEKQWSYYEMHDDEPKLPMPQ